MTSPTNIFLAGASRGVGREVAQQAQHRRLIALLRSETVRPELEAMGIAVVVGDALDAASSAANVRLCSR